MKSLWLAGVAAVKSFVPLMSLDLVGLVLGISNLSRSSWQGRTTVPSTRFWLLWKDTKHIEKKISLKLWPYMTPPYLKGRQIRKSDHFFKNYVFFFPASSMPNNLMHALSYPIIPMCHFHFQQGTRFCCSIRLVANLRSFFTVPQRVGRRTFAAFMVKRWTVQSCEQLKVGVGMEAPNNNKFLEIMKS